jgi:hypothetical protein
VELSQPSHHPIPSSDPASLPFALAPSSARFHLESVVRALPSLRRSQSADRFNPIHQLDRRRYAVARTRRLKREYSGGFRPDILKPLPLLPSEACLLSKQNLFRAGPFGAVMGPNRTISPEFAVHCGPAQALPLLNRSSTSLHFHSHALRRVVLGSVPVGVRRASAAIFQPITIRR